MLGFTLSKLNLLILVTALFAIIAFFMGNISEMMVGWTAQRMINGYITAIDGVTRSNVSCFQEQMTIPSHISYFGGLEQSSRFFYVMEITREPEEYDPEYLTKVIIKIANRKDQDKFIATNSVDVNARVYLYQWPVADGSITTDIEEQSSVLMDPAKGLSISSNSALLIKEEYMGKNYVHIILCSSGPGQCELNKGYAGCCIKKCRGKESSCVEPADDCPANLSCYRSLSCD